MKSGRRQAREEALQILYELDLNRDLTAAVALQYFQELFARSAKPMDAFCKTLVMGVTEKLPEIDTCLKMFPNIGGRIAWLPWIEISFVWEFMSFFFAMIFGTVTINEMIEIAKSFGSEHTPAFVNGILDKIKSQHPSSTKAQ